MTEEDTISGAGRGLPLRVALIEDSPILCEMLRDVLEELDGVVVVADAEDERGALAELERKQVDLAIVDLELRTGSGLGVLSHLRAQPERFGNPRAVVFSNYGHEVMRVRCQALGVERFFDKSFETDSLIDFVQAEVERRRA